MLGKLKYFFVVVDSINRFITKVYFTKDKMKSILFNNYPYFVFYFKWFWDQSNGIFIFEEVQLGEFIMTLLRVLSTVVCLEEYI